MTEPPSRQRGQMSSTGGDFLVRKGARSGAMWLRQKIFVSAVSVMHQATPASFPATRPTRRTAVVLPASDPHSACGMK